MELKLFFHLFFTWEVINNEPISLVDFSLAQMAGNIYRPHPKDDGRLYFQSVHTCGGRGGTPSQV